MMEPNKI